MKWQIKFIKQVEYATQESKFCDSFCVTEMSASVTVFLKELSGVALVTQELWPVIYL